MSEVTLYYAGFSRVSTRVYLSMGHIAGACGLDIIRLSKLLGHANPTVTQNIYVHIMDPDLREAGERFSIKMPTGTETASAAQVEKGQKRGK
jgi:hypothetical protein